MPTRFPRTVEVVMHRKYYLEPKLQFMVGAGGFSSSGTARRSENPVSERVAVCSTLFSEEDKGRIDCSPLKGRAAQPCLPAAAHGHAEVQAPHLSRYAGCPPPVAFHGLTLWTICAGRGYSDELGTDFYIPTEISMCYNHVFAGSYRPPVEICKPEFPGST